jgi:hypothetical protein
MGNWIMRKIIAFAGLIGSGKGTAADHLIKNHNFVGLSFAESLKDCLSAVFHWDRELLEGVTPESREWRERVDHYWAQKLQIKNFSPRMAMQHIGTDLFRNYFNDYIWTHSLEKKILDLNTNIVVSDLRFYNESVMLRNLGANIVRIARGDDPVWYSLARICPDDMKILYPAIHASEYSWASIEFDSVIDNNGSLDSFLTQINHLVE